MTCLCTTSSYKEGYRLFRSVTNNMSRGIIALDCDGVLLNYQQTFAHIYEKTFGKQLEVVSPNAYHVSSSICESLVRTFFI